MTKLRMGNLLLTPIRFMFGLLLAAGCLTAIQTSDAQELDQAMFVELHKSLQPKNEAWKTIPWETDLLKAQEKAAKTNKPIFMWAMDGHPLGCT